MIASSKLRRLMMAAGIGMMAGILLALGSGCNVTVPKLPWPSTDTETTLPVAFTNLFPATGGAETKPETGLAQDDVDVSKVKFWYVPVGSWAITSDLPAVHVGGGKVRFKHSKAGTWPRHKDGFEANPWVIAMVDGELQAASFEWLRPGTIERPMKTVNGAHCGVGKLNRDWAPKSGETVYIGVAACSRGNRRTVAERTAFKRVVWP